MQRKPDDVLGVRVVDGRGLGVGLLDQAGDEPVGGEAACRDQTGDGPVAPAACRGLEVASLCAGIVKDGADIETHHEVFAAVDVMGQLVETVFDVDFADIAVGQADAVEGDVARAGKLDHRDEGNLLAGSGLGHGLHSMTDSVRLSLGSHSVTKRSAALFL